MKKRDLSFWILLAGVIAVAVSLFLVWLKWKRTYQVEDPEPVEPVTQEPEPAQTIKVELKTEPEDFTPPFVEPETNNGNE
jgi:hypothetical protein